MNRASRLEKGFTLLEAFMVLAILAIVLAIAAPSFTQLIANKQVDSSVSQIAQAFNLARAEAVARNLPTSVCPNSNGNCGASWAGGALVFVDQDQDGAQDAGDVTLETIASDFSQLTFTANNYTNSVTYLADGSVTVNGSIRVCSAYGFGMQISINAIGRPRIADASAGC